MKQLYVLLLATGGSLAAVAQAPKSSYSSDAMLSRWVIDVNILGGLNSQKFTTANSTPNYLNALNANPGDINYKTDFAYGGDAQLGFFFGKKRHFGLGAGFMYLRQHGTIELNNYHMEYQSYDYAGSTFRQVMSGNNLHERLAVTNMNIPVVLKYKNRFSKRWGFTADAGALFNVRMESAYTTHASFDYEAIYKFVPSSDGGTTAVYDNSPVASLNDWMITKAEFLRNNPEGNMDEYFKTKRALGYSVGLNQSPSTTKGNVSYTKGSVGLLLQPSFNYFLSDNVALNFGGYYLLQPFKNDNQANYRLTDGSGNYSSMLNNVTESVNQSYGLNVGARFFLGKKKTPISISSTDNSSPTQCGLCDGNIVLHGLTPDQSVAVNYSKNGVMQEKYTTTVQKDGQVKIPNLCAGSYTGITATIKGKSAVGTSVTLADPQISITAQDIRRPSAPKFCDGSVKFSGLTPGKSVTINYSIDGKSQPAFNGVVNSDRSVTMGSLCEGNYSNITAVQGSCSTQGADFVMAAPVPPVVDVPVAQPETPKETDISSPILFETDRAYVDGMYHDEINDAVEALRKNRAAYLVIDGHADTTGAEMHNKELSLRRANAVKEQLVKKGIGANRIKSRGHGSEVPVAPNETTEGRQQNRRSVMKLVTDKNQP